MEMTKTVRFTSYFSFMLCPFMNLCFPLIWTKDVSQGSAFYCPWSNSEMSNHSSSETQVTLVQSHRIIKSFQIWGNIMLSLTHLSFTVSSVTVDECLLETAPFFDVNVDMQTSRSSKYQISCWYLRIHSSLNVNCLTCQSLSVAHNFTSNYC